MDNIMYKSAPFESRLYKGCGSGIKRKQEMETSAVPSYYVPNNHPVRCLEPQNRTVQLSSSWDWLQLLLPLCNKGQRLWSLSQLSCLDVGGHYLLRCAVASEGHGQYETSRLGMDGDERRGCE